MKRLVRFLVVGWLLFLAALAAMFHDDEAYQEFMGFIEAAGGDR